MVVKGVVEIVDEGGRLLHRQGNLVMDAGLTALADMVSEQEIEVGPPDYIAVGLQRTPALDADTTLTALEDELDREVITSVSRQSTTARYCSIFQRNRGVGTWQELGLFYGAPKTVMISQCDAGEGTQYSASTIAFHDNGASPDTITDSASGFSFSSGDVIRVTGSASNDGLYTVAEATSGTLTLSSSDELTDEAAGSSVTIRSGWHGSNTLSAETTDYRSGSAALESSGPNSATFWSDALKPDYGGYTFTTSDYLQFWYYIQDTTTLGGDLTCIIGSSASSTNHIYTFTIPLASLSNGWNWVNLQISSGTPTGSPNLNAIQHFRLTSPKQPATDALERIDRIRLFSQDGSLWCRAPLTTSITKAIGECRTVYWYLIFS